MIHSLSERLTEVNDIIRTCSEGTIPFEQAYVISRFYYDFQDTNVIIDEAETIATKDAGRLRELAVMLKDETATLREWDSQVEYPPMQTVYKTNNQRINAL